MNKLLPLAFTALAVLPACRDFLEDSEGKLESGPKSVEVVRFDADFLTFGTNVKVNYCLDFSGPRFSDKADFLINQALAAAREQDGRANTEENSSEDELAIILRKRDRKPFKVGSKNPLLQELLDIFPPEEQARIEREDEARDRFELEEMLMKLGDLPYAPFADYLRLPNDYYNLVDSVEVLNKRGINLCDLIEKSGRDSYHVLQLLEAWYEAADRNQAHYGENYLELITLIPEELKMIFQRFLTQLNDKQREDLIDKWEMVNDNLVNVLRKYRNGKKALFALEQIVANWDDYVELYEPWSYQHLSVWVAYHGIPVEVVFSDEIIKRATALTGETGFYNGDIYSELLGRYGLDDFIGAAELLHEKYNIGMASFMDFYEKSTPMKALVEEVGLLEAVKRAETIAGFKEFTKECNTCKFNQEDIGYPGE